MVNIMENLSSLKAYVFEKKDEVFSTFKAFTNKNARAVYWVSVVLMGVSGLADALLLSSTVFSKNFLLFTAFLGIGLFLYKAVEKGTPEEKDQLWESSESKSDDGATIRVITRE